MMKYTLYLTTINSIFNYIIFSSGSEICNPLLEKLAVYFLCWYYLKNYSQNQGNAIS